MRKHRLYVLAGILFPSAAKKTAVPGVFVDSSHEKNLQMEQAYMCLLFFFHP